MKITKQILKRIIKEELQNMQEVNFEKVVIPAQVKRFLDKFVDSMKDAKLNRIKRSAILYKVINAAGISTKTLMQDIQKIKQGMSKNEGKLKESGILYKAGVKKYGKEGMDKILSAAGKKKSHAAIGAIKDKYEKKSKKKVKEEKGGKKPGGKHLIFVLTKELKKAQKCLTQYGYKEGKHYTIQPNPGTKKTMGILLDRKILNKVVEKFLSKKVNVYESKKSRLPENWFTDLKDKAKKAYIKANPTSKYAKAAKSKDDLAQKGKEVSDRESKNKEIRSKNREVVSKTLSSESRNGEFNPKDMVSQDPAKRLEAIEAFSDSLSSIYPDSEDMGDEYEGWEGNAKVTQPKLLDKLLSSGDNTPKVMKLLNNIASNEDTYEEDYDALYKELSTIKRGGLVGGTYAAALGEPPAIKKEREKKAAIRREKERKQDAYDRKHKKGKYAPEEKKKKDSKSSNFAQKLGTAMATGAAANAAGGFGR